jgi:hypothetical protein
MSLLLFKHLPVSNRDHFYLLQYYPVGLTDLKARRPSKLERYWAINTVLSAGLCYLGYITTKHLQDGSLQRRCISIRDHVTSLVSEHIVEPISKLGEEFFEKLHRREGIVSREDLVQSRQALTRMLADFSKHGQRSYDVRQMMRGASFSPIGFNEPDTTATAATATAVPSNSHSSPDASKHTTSGNGHHPPAGSSNHSNGNNESDVLKASPIDETDAMEALMRTYEKQLQSPIYGMLYGNLMTAMLIQMQKLKGICPFFRCFPSVCLAFLSFSFVILPMFPERVHTGAIAATLIFCHHNSSSPRSACFLYSCIVLYPIRFSLTVINLSYLHCFLNLQFTFYYLILCTPLLSSHYTAHTVHTEAAMLTMDQILASNELTMAATAAMPAMVRHIPCWFKQSSVFSPSSLFFFPFLFLFSFLSSFLSFFVLLCSLSTLLALCILINPIIHDFSLVHAAH